MAWLTSGAGVRKASSEDDDKKRPSRQSWVLTTRDPSAQMIDAMSDATEQTGGAAERLGKLAVKLAIVDGTEELGGVSSDVKH